MCGIVGYLGKTVKASLVIDKLKKLEYRGYDSAGISANLNGSYQVIKTVGEIKCLEQILPINWSVDCALAHTRWATNGKPSTENAHPHISQNQKWAIVHNGIVENAEALKSKYEISTIGQTDTEVLVEFIAKRNPSNIYEFIKIFKEVQGSYAIICQNIETNTFYIAKNKSQIMLALNSDGDVLMASDPICFVGFAEKYYILKDMTFVEVKKQSLKFYDLSLKQITAKHLLLSEEMFCENQENCQHYMLKEIFQQSEAIKNQVQKYKKYNNLRKFNQKFISTFQSVRIIGCGSAYHAGLIGEKYFEKILNMPSQAEIASEFLYNNRVIDYKKTLFIFISQSGETADTVEALNYVQKFGATTLAITNVLHSSLAQKAKFVLPIFVGPEIAVASTKAYVGQISALYLLVNAFRGKLCFKDVENVADRILNFDLEKVEAVAQNIFKTNFVFMIGKDLDFVLAKESALKLQEISYIQAHSLPAGELKHGYLALVEADVPIFVFCTQKSLKSKVESASQEASSRGGKIYFVSNLFENADIKLETLPELLMPMILIAPMQYLAYKVSVLRKLNPDKPRNLAKSVTVE